MSIEIGQRFERLVVVAVDPPRRGRRADCRCDCGEHKSIAVDKLLSGKTRSCGCMRRELRAQKNLKHGMSKSPTWYSWAGMIERCLSASHKNYDRYGGRGIAVCERWQGERGFATFLADMGERPLGTTIERIDNDRGYEPGNCRWATRKEQGQNTSTTKLSAVKAREVRRLVAMGHSQISVGARFGVAQTTVSQVVRHETW